MTTAVRPEPGAPRAYHFPAFERTALENGLQVVVAPVHKLPVATMMFVAPAGAAAEPAGEDGVANLTAQALLEGTARSDGAALIRRAERLGASLSAAADWDAAFVAVTVLTPRLREAAALLGEVLVEPIFPDREVERLRAERLAELLQLRAEPRGLASDMFARFVYPPASRYARPEDGGEASVSALDRAAVVRFHRARYQPRGGALIIVGDVTVDQAVKLARETLGGWEGPAPTASRVADSGTPKPRAVHIVNLAGAPQSELRIGHVGLPRSTPDYFPVLVMNAVLGGLFSSRINLNLREVHGYTYGASSGFSWRRGAGPFVVSSAVRSDVTADAAREVLLEIERLRAEPISEDELTLATSYLAGVFPIRYESTDAIARALAALVVYELSGDYFDRYRDRVRAVTTTDVLQAAGQHLHSGELQFVVVGDAEAVEKPLEALDLGAVSVTEPDRQPNSSSA